MVHYAALLHDVGEVVAMASYEPGPLMHEERELVRAHVRMAASGPRKIRALEDVAEVVLRITSTTMAPGFRMESPGQRRLGGAHGSHRPYGAMLKQAQLQERYADEWARAELSGLCRDAV